MNQKKTNQKAGQDCCIFIKIAALFILTVFLSSCSSGFFYSANAASGFDFFNVINKIPEEENNITPVVLFTYTDEPLYAMLSLINAAGETIDCAFYDLKHPDIINALIQSSADVRLVLDFQNYMKNNNMKTEEGIFLNQSSKIKFGEKNIQMHHKFCIFDEKVVLTGSLNPTERGFHKNDNNIIIISSDLIANNYINEFEYLWNERKKKNKYNKNVYLNGIMIENYFCPADCSHTIYTKLIDAANESVYFMTFSFTKEEIGDSLVFAHERGIEVKGVFERTQNNQWTQKNKLDEAGIDAKWDLNPANMHNKIFIIDRSVIITGSANPSNNGFTRNDENILILHDKSIAEQFLLEFDRVYGEMY